jgi:hypothetical protein
MDVDVDLVPIGEVVDDLIVALGIRVAEVAEGLVREDDAEAEGVVGAVALVDGNVVGRVLLLHQQAEVEPGGAAADDGNLHRIPPPRVARLGPG